MFTSDDAMGTTLAEGKSIDCRAAAWFAGSTRSFSFRQDKQNEVLVTSSLLNEKQIELEQMRGMVKREEHKAEEEGDRVKGVCRESGQVMLAINNLHSR